MLKEGLTVGAIHKRRIERLCVAQCLLHARADGMRTVCDLDDRNRVVTLIEKKDVDAFLFTALDHRTTHHNATGRKRVLFADVRMQIPPRPYECRYDVLGRYVLFR